MKDPMKTPSINDLECLILWPKGSVGYAEEYALVSSLLRLCDRHGYGRVPQLAAAIEEIWNDPSKRAVYEEMKKRHEDLMREDKEAINSR